MKNKFELIDELLPVLSEVSEEITRLNSAAGQTIFNPTVTSIVRNWQRALTSERAAFQPDFTECLHDA